MFIRVLLNTGQYHHVKPQVLESLIDTEAILCFYRKSGVVVLGVDRVRSSEPKPFDGPERRNVHNYSSYFDWILHHSIDP